MTIPRVSSFVNCGGTGNEAPGMNRRLVAAGSLQRLALEQAIIADDHGVGVVHYHNLCGLFELPGVYPKTNGGNRLMWVHQFSLAADAGLPVSARGIQDLCDIHHGAGQDVEMYLGSPGAYPGDNLEAELGVYEPVDTLCFDATYDYHQGDAVDRQIQRLRELDGHRVLVEPGLVDDDRTHGEVDGTIVNDRGMDNAGIRLELGDIQPLKRQANHTIMQRDYTADELVEAWEAGYSLSLRLFKPIGREVARRIQEIA